MNRLTALDPARPLLRLSLAAIGATWPTVALALAGWVALDRLLFGAGALTAALAWPMAFVVLATVVAMPVHRALLTGGGSTGLAALGHDRGRTAAVFALTVAPLYLPFEAVGALLPDRAIDSAAGVAILAALGLAQIGAFLVFGSALAEAARGRLWRYGRALGRFRRHWRAILIGWGMMIGVMLAGAFLIGALTFALQPPVGQAAAPLWMVLGGSALLVISEAILAVVFTRALLADERGAAA